MEVSRLRSGEVGERLEKRRARPPDCSLGLSYWVSEGLGSGTELKGLGPSGPRGKVVLGVGRVE